MKKALRIGGGALLFFALMGAYGVHNAVSGHGRLHQMARALYHEVKIAKAKAVRPVSSATDEPPERADAPMVIYADALGDGWQDYSWATHDLKCAAPVHTGAFSISMLPKEMRGVYFHHDGIDTVGFGALEAWVYGTGGLTVSAIDGGNQFLAKIPLSRYGVPLSGPAHGWQHVHIPLADLGLTPDSATINGIAFQASRVPEQPTVYFDDIRLLPDPALPPAPTSAAVSVAVNWGVGQKPISPFIYGMAFAPADYLSDLRLGVNRWGGNDKTRYNWVQGNADNAARDWDWRNRKAYGESTSGPSSAADEFVRLNQANKARTMLTVPTIGWVSRDTDNGHKSESVPDGGDPLRDVNGPIKGYDPTENRVRTSIRSVARKGSPFTLTPTMNGGIIYQDEWVYHLKKTFGPTMDGGVTFYAMDNEPDIWDHTHTDVHPARMGYDDLLHTFLDYATAVKAVDQTAYVTGPVSWGWTGFNYSALDRGSDNFHTHADRSRHGNLPFLSWFLKSVAAHDAKTGQRSLDVLDVHYYPQGDGLYSDRDDPATQKRRLRSTRSLWDSSYSDESWIGEPIYLLPRLKQWIGQGYPGTRFGVTEWSFGGDQHPDGGLAIADALGIFGQQGTYLACYWAYPPKDSMAYHAFKLYRNADGQGHGFGDLTGQAASDHLSRLSCYAATDSLTGAKTLMLVNKMPKAKIRVTLNLSDAPRTGTVRLWQVSADNPKQIVAAQAALPTAEGRPLMLTVPPYSQTLLRFGPALGGPRP